MVERCVGDPGTAPGRGEITWQSSDQIQPAVSGGLWPIVKEIHCNVPNSVTRAKGHLKQVARQSPIHALGFKLITHKSIVRIHPLLPKRHLYRCLFALWGILAEREPIARRSQVRIYRGPPTDDHGPGRDADGLCPGGSRVGQTAKFIARLFLKGMGVQASSP